MMVQKTPSKHLSSFNIRKDYYTSSGEKFNDDELSEICHGKVWPICFRTCLSKSPNNVSGIFTLLTGLLTRFRDYLYACKIPCQVLKNTHVMGKPLCLFNCLFLVLSEGIMS